MGSGRLSRINPPNLPKLRSWQGADPVASTSTLAGPIAQALRKGKASGSKDSAKFRAHMLVRVNCKLQALEIFCRTSENAASMDINGVKAVYNSNYWRHSAAEI